MRQYENFWLRTGMARSPPPLSNIGRWPYAPLYTRSKRHKHQRNTSILNTLHLHSKICNLLVIPTQTPIHFQVVLNFTSCVIHFL